MVIRSFLDAIQHPGTARRRDGRCYGRLAVFGAQGPTTTVRRNSPANGRRGSHLNCRHRPGSVSTTAAAGGNNAPLHDELVQQITEIQDRVIELIGKREMDEASALIEAGLQRVDRALKRFPQSAALNLMKGYLLKDRYQSSKNRLPVEQRKEFLPQAGAAFLRALRLDTGSAGAHSGLGNIFFFLGEFDAAIAHHNTALELAHGDYPAAEHDKRLVEQICDGRIPFNF